MSFIQTIGKSRYLTLGLGLLATTAPVVAQTTTAPAAPATTAPAPAAPATGVIDPAAKALLTQTVERYRGIQNLSLMFDQGSRPQLIQFRAPGALKVTSFDSKGGVSVEQFYTDTEMIVMQKPNDVFEWISMARPALAEGQDARARVATTSAGGGFFPSLLAGLDPFREGATYAASSLALGTETTVDGVAVIPIVATIPKKPKLPYDMTVTMFIGKDDHLVHKNEVVLKSADGKENKIVESFKGIKINTDLPASAFIFTAPQGATKVENFSRPKLRAVVGQAPLGLNAKDLDGKEINFDQYKGKVVLVDFWATWCGPCIGELPNVKANYEKYKGQGFDVLGISLDQTTEPLTKFIKEKEMPWRQVFDGHWNGPIATAYNVQSIPATILIGKDGKIAAVGARGEELEPAIQAALAAR